MKKFIITIDTEGDNLWGWREGDKISTNNTKFLSRFQELCNKYNFKPVWLTNYEMMCDDDYVAFIKDVVSKGNGELGMHLHAWNNPPYHYLPIDQDGAPYLIEYPVDVMDKKIATLTKLIEEKTGIKPTTHRAGRWAMNDSYFELLCKYGYNVDCSYTPYIDWKSSFGRTKGFVGSNYSKVRNKIYTLSFGDKKITEMPVTIKKTHKWFKPQHKGIMTLAKSIYRALMGESIWLRPNGSNLEKMKYIVRSNKKDYVMFMIHSSEFMPGGSPNFRTEKDIEKLYSDMESLFEYASKNYEGITIADYFNQHEKR